MYFYRFFPFLCKGLCILYNEDEIAATACAGHFPQDIRREYVEDVRRMLPLWNKTEEEFIRDVETMIDQEKEESPCL